MTKKTSKSNAVIAASSVVAAAAADDKQKHVKAKRWRPHLLLLRLPLPIRHRQSQAKQHRRTSRQHECRTTYMVNIQRARP